MILTKEFFNQTKRKFNKKMADSCGVRAGAERPKGVTNKTQRPTETLRSARIVLSCTEDEKARLKAMADAQGKSVTEFILDALLK